MAKSRRSSARSHVSSDGRTFVVQMSKFWYEMPNIVTLRISLPSNGQQGVVFG